MLRAIELRQYILTLEKSDDAAKRIALHSLRLQEESDWAATPLAAVRSLVGTLTTQLLKETNQPHLQKDIVTVLGNIGAISKPALPRLIELLHNDVTDSVREAAV